MLLGNRTYNTRENDLNLQRCVENIDSPTLPLPTVPVHSGISVMSIYGLVHTYTPKTKKSSGGLSALYKQTRENGLKFQMVHSVERECLMFQITRDVADKEGDERAASPSIILSKLIRCLVVPR